jgi:hypothetical protein
MILVSNLEFNILLHSLLLTIIFLTPNNLFLQTIFRGMHSKPCMG